MAEIKVTYETLFDLLRREKGRNELQDLEKTFYEDVSAYMGEKKKSLSMSSSRGEQEKINIQLKNVKKIIRELYELREKKIISLASSKVRTGSDLIDTSKLLVKEKELFDDACNLFYKFKSEILESVLSESVEFSASLENKKAESSSKSHSSGEEPSSEVKSEFEESSKEPSVKSEGEVSADELVELKILNNLPRFLGVDKKIYGPFSKGDLTSMPFSTAKLLLDKNRAERV